MAPDLAPDSETCGAHISQRSSPEDPPMQRRISGAPAACERRISTALDRSGHSGGAVRHRTSGVGARAAQERYVNGASARTVGSERS